MAEQMEVDEEYGDMYNRAKINRPIATIQVSGEAISDWIYIGKVEACASFPAT